MSNSKEFRPWVACETPDLLGATAGLFEIYNAPFGLGRVAWATTKENAARIAACVNGCKGVADPSSLDDLLKAASHILEKLYHPHASVNALDCEMLRTAIAKVKGA